VTYWRSNEVSIDSLDEVKQEASREEHSSSTECTDRLEGCQDPAEQVIVPKIKKRPTWLRSTLEEGKDM